MTRPAETTTRLRTDYVHILPVTLLETQADLVREFRGISQDLGVPLGWHYLLDLAWAASELDGSHLQDWTVLDAGAGTGLMQWWLANRGASVISVDRANRRFPRAVRAWCPIVDLKSRKPYSPRREAFQAARSSMAAADAKSTLRSCARLARELVSNGPRPAPAQRGAVYLLQADLRDLSEIPADSLDAVVSISSLEHNEPDKLVEIVSRLMKLLKPGRKLIATLGASNEADWYHEPSQGWCYTEETLRRIFDLPADCVSNYADYDALFEELRGCAELRDNLSDFYFRSANNGMPWGRWDPQYQSVGVVKVKTND